MIGGDGRFFIGLASGSAFAILGTLIFVYRPHNRIGWLCLGTGLGLLYGNTIDLYVPCGLAGTIRAPGLVYAIWYNYSYGIFNLLPMFILLPMVYPTGQFFVAPLALDNHYRNHRCACWRHSDGADPGFQPG